MRGTAIPRWCGDFIRSGGPRAQAEPNPAHIALADLEAKLGARFFLCTQNVDDLHERAGSVRLVHMHGELARSRCEDECGRAPVEDRAIYGSLDEVGRCACGGRLRPHIVFFGEIPLEMEHIEREIAKATLMVVVGTSGSVYPAANFVNWARRSFVKKGQTGIRILAPLMRKVEEEKNGTTERVSRPFEFKTVAVFDYAQTDGEPLPELNTNATEGGDAVTATRRPHPWMTFRKLRNSLARVFASFAKRAFGRSVTWPGV